MRVKDVMTQSPMTVGAEAPIKVAADLMRAHGMRHLPVVDEGGCLLGVLTDRDLRHAAFLPALVDQLAWDPRRLKSLRVRDVMTWAAVTTTSEATLAHAGLTMFQRRIGSLPVVDDGRLVGILTETDVLRALRRDQPLEAEFDFLW
jgi:acetoin utilization protein AcuB